MDFKINSKKTLYQGFFKMEELRVEHELFDGGMSPEIRRELMVRPEAACILLYDPELDVVVLIEQFRVPAIYGSNPWLIELVAGLLDKDTEQPDKVARREAIEEAGLEVKRLEKITEYWSSPGASNEYIHLFIGEVDAKNAGGIHGLEEEGEDIRVLVFDSEKVASMIKSGQINNGAAIIALQWFIQSHQNIRRKWLNQ